MAVLPASNHEDSDFSPSGQPPSPNCRTERRLLRAVSMVAVRQGPITACGAPQVPAEGFWGVSMCASLAKGDIQPSIDIEDDIKATSMTKFNGLLEKND